VGSAGREKDDREKRKKCGDIFRFHKKSISARFLPVKMQRPNPVRTSLKGHASGICFALVVTPTREVLSHSQQLIGI